MLICDEEAALKWIKEAPSSRRVLDVPNNRSKSFTAPMKFDVLFLTLIYSLKVFSINRPVALLGCYHIRLWMALFNANKILIFINILYRMNLCRSFLLRIFPYSFLRFCLKLMLMLYHSWLYEYVAVDELF